MWQSVMKLDSTNVGSQTLTVIISGVTIAGGSFHEECGLKATTDKSHQTLELTCCPINV